MKFNVEVTNDTLTRLAKDIMENYPEYSFCLQCIKYNYEKGEYKFLDDEENKVYIVTIEDIAIKGLPKFIQAWLDGKYHFCGIDTFTDLLDPCSYDTISLDGVVQMTIFGEILYG